MKTIAKNPFFVDIKEILSSARQRAYSAVNSAMVEAYWQIGRRIVEEEQQGKARADYGKYLIRELSKELTAEFGDGFSERSIFQYKQFYLMFPAEEIRRTVFAEFEVAENEDDTIVRTVFAQSESETIEIQRAPFAQFGEVENFQYLSRLNWSQIQRIMRVSSPQAREYYLKETAENMWSVRTLDRNISTLYYERLISSQTKEPVVEEMLQKTADFQQDKTEFIKNPTVMEFLGLPANKAYTESELEEAIVSDMQKFLLELGKGFAFVDRQQLVRTDTQDFYIDLVFYNYMLQCFVIVELKTNKITHQDIGQLDMYVRMYDNLKRGENHNPTIGILLCTETDHTIARYSVLNENKQLFASKYMPFLPTEEELAAEIERQKLMLKLGK